MHGAWPAVVVALPTYGLRGAVTLSDRDAPLDVFLVHYGSAVKGTWASAIRAPKASVPTTAKGTSAVSSASGGGAGEADPPLTRDPT